MLIKSVSDLKEHLGRAISKATSDDFFVSYIRLAQDDFIIPAIGPELFDELDTALNNPSSTTPMEPKKKALLSMLQRSLAFYAYWKYLPFSLGTDGDGGLQEQETDKSKPVRMGVLEKRLRESILNAGNSLERALVYLYASPNDFPTWKNSPSYQQGKGLMIANATELTEYLPQAGGSYRFFLSLRPYLKEAELNDILPVIGQAQYNDLKAALVSPVIDGDQKKLLRVIGPALAACAYREALFYLNVVQTDTGGLRIVSAFDGITNEKAVDPKILDKAKSLADTKAAQALNTLSRFLEANLSLYPLYANSTARAGGKPFDLPDNDQYRGIFRMR